MFPDFDEEAMNRHAEKMRLQRKQAESDYEQHIVLPEQIGTRKGAVHAASILVWTKIAELAGVPFIPAETVVSIPMDLVELVMDNREGEMTAEHVAALKTATDYCDGGGFWRSELCAPSDVKGAMAYGQAMPDVLPFCLDDPRLLDMHYTMPDVKVVSRPRMTPVIHAGFPVEFRTFFGGDAADGAASWYYPQAGRFDVTPGLEAAMDAAIGMGRRLHDLRAELGLSPVMPDTGMFGAKIGSTIDFMLTVERGLVLVDAGPGFGYGAHPCCFIDVPVEGKRWHLADGVELH